MVFVAIILLIVLLLSHCYYIYKLYDMHLDEMVGFAIIMGVFKLIVLCFVMNTVLPSEEERYVSCVNTLPKDKIQYCDKHLRSGN